MKIVFATQSYQYLQTKVLALGDYEEGKTDRKYFPDGERYQRIMNPISGRDVVIIGGTISDSDTLEIYDLACALDKHGAKSLTLVIPYYGYSTMERGVKPGEVVTAKTRARLFSAIPHNGLANRIILFDLHVEGLSHYFEGNIQPIHIYCKELVMEAAREFAGDDFILACTDAGRAKWVESLANDMGVDAAFVFKRRLSGDSTQITGINAEVAGRKVVIYDDMIRTGGSLINAAKAYQEAGASEVYAITTHGLFSNNALERIKQSGYFRGVASTDTHANTQEILDDDFVKIKSVAGLINHQLKTLA